MKRLLDVPVRVVHGGHFPSYDGGRHRQIVRRWLDDRGRRVAGVPQDALPDASRETAVAYFRIPSMPSSSSIVSLAGPRL